MIKPVFSTVACPQWTLDHVFDNAAKYGYLGVDLRTFGDGSRGFACEPSLTAPEKIRGWAERAGTPVEMLSTSTHFDAPIWPPVLGNAIADNDGSVREAKRAIDLAASIECPLVRVFGFDIPTKESTASATIRIVDRLKDVVDHAHRTGVRVALENGGSFPTAASLLPVLQGVNSNLLGACYSVAIATKAGEKPDAGVAALGDRLFALRVKDVKAGLPVQLGTGEINIREAIGAANRAGFDGPVSFEWDRAWLPTLESPETILPGAAKTLFAYLTEFGASGERSHGRAPARA